jgi:hypothetical protein
MIMRFARCDKKAALKESAAQRNSAEKAARKKARQDNKGKQPFDIAIAVSLYCFFRVYLYSSISSS